MRSDPRASTWDVGRAIFQFEAGRRVCMGKWMAVVEIMKVS